MPTMPPNTGWTWLGIFLFVMVLLDLLIDAKVIHVG